MKYLSIHGIVGLEIDDNYKWYDTLIPNIPMFESNAKEVEKIGTKIKVTYKKKLELKESYEVVPYIFINRNTNQFYDKKYGCIVSKENNGYRIECSQECNEWIMMLLEYCLLLNNATFIHSAGVAKDGKAYVFPSWGGVGKTASVAKLIRENNYQLLGDDLVILDKDGIVHAFPKKFVLYAYHKKLFKESMKNKKLIKGGLSNLVSHLIPTIKSILRHFPFVMAWARRHNPQSKRVTPYEIFGEKCIATDAKLSGFTWLERIEVEKTKTSEIDSYKLASRALMITLHELYDTRLQEFVIALCADNFEFKYVFDNSIKFIEKVISDKEINQLFIPQNYPIENVAQDVVDYTLSIDKK